MVKQNWEISDNDRERILSLHKNRTKNHYLFTEQNESKVDRIVVPFDLKWGMGRYKITPVQVTAIQNKLKEIQNFLFKNKDSDITIQIESGESRVTNYDGETGGKTPLAQGVLAQNRADNVIVFLKGYFNNLVNQNYLKKLPTFPEPIIKIGKTEYTKGSNDLKNPAKVELYKSEQFVRAIISVSKDYECIVGLEVTIGYYRGQSSKEHACDEAIFELKMNGVSIGEVNLNNSLLDIKLDQIESSYQKSLVNYKKKLTNANNAFTELVNSGVDKEKNRQKYLNTYAGQEPVRPEIPEQIKQRALRLGYNDVGVYVNELMTINNAFKSYGRKSDGVNGGSRSQTFMIDGAKAKSIIDNSPSENIVLSIVPLVSKDGKYKIFYGSGSHSDTPWVTIKSKKSTEPLYNGEPNINMKRGSTDETVLLVTDLCGNPIKNP